MKRVILFVIITWILVSCVTSKMPLPVNDNVIILNLYSGINSDSSDYSPCLLPNGKDFLFVTDRTGTIVNFYINKFSHDIWLAQQQVLNDPSYTAFPLPNNSDEDSTKLILNTEFNEGGLCISYDFKKLYFTGCNRVDVIGDCDLYEADIEFYDKLIIVKNIKNMGPNINTNKWESMPSISPDSKTLYFISNKDVKKNREIKNILSKYRNDVFTEFSNENRKNAEKYNYDIYYSEYDEHEEKWSSAKKLPKIINSDRTEYSPIICSDNKTLIFASKGHEPMGYGLDFFYSKKDNSGTWSLPVNFGKPMNSEFDEAFLTLNHDCEFGFFSSLRNYPHKNFDIYQVEMKSIIDDVKIISWRQKSKADVKIIINDEFGKPINMIILENVPSGIHSFEWDWKDKNGQEVKPGKYYYDINIGVDSSEFSRLLWRKQ